jgi:hypothetical protein
MAERKEDDSKNLRTLAQKLKEHEKGDNLSSDAFFPASKWSLKHTISNSNGQ